MGSIAPAKILVVLVIALVVLGPERLPNVAKQAGKAWADFRRFRANLETEVRGTLGEGPETIGGALNEFRDTLRDTVASSSAGDGVAQGASSTAPRARDEPPQWRPPSAGSRDAPSARLAGPPPDDPSFN